MKRPLALVLCFFFPFLILLAGMTLAGLYGFRAIPKLLVETGRGMVPEGFVIKAGEPGEYTLWLQVRGQHRGELHEGVESLPHGGKVYLFDDSSKREIPVKQWLTSTKNLRGERAVSLGTFLVQREAQRIEVKGSGFNKPILLSISPSNSRGILIVVLTVLSIVALTLTVAIFLFISLLHRRQKMMEEAYHS